MHHHNDPLVDKMPLRVNLMYTVIIGRIARFCRTADLTHPMIKQQIHRDRPVFWRPSFPGEGTFDPAGSLLTRGSGTDGLPKRERYVPRVSAGVRSQNTNN